MFGVSETAVGIFHPAYLYAGTVCLKHSVKKAAVGIEVAGYCTVVKPPITELSIIHAPL